MYELRNPTVRVNMFQAKAKVLRSSTPSEYYDPGFAKQYVAGLVGPEQCRLPSAQKCEWFTRDGPQLFVAITLICTAVATKPTPSHSFYHPPFFCVTLLFAPLL